MISNLLSKIKPSPTIAMSNRAKELKNQGIYVIDFSVGEPDLPTPKHICDAVNEAMEKGMTRYTIVDGTIDLRKAICGKLLRENGLNYDISEISVGTGAKQVIFNAMMASINAGDEVIIPTPSWVSYVDIVAMFDGVPVLVPTKMEDNFCLKAADLEAKITPKTKWLMLNSPSNPTGSVYSPESLAEIADVLRKNPHVNIMTDDIYEHIIFDDLKFTNILNIAPDLSEKVMIINGVSKSYCMTGFRIGYGACKNKNLIGAMRTIQSQSTSSPNAMAQYAAQIALNSSESMVKILEMRKIMQERRDFVYAELSKIDGIKTLMGQGAFYAFSDISALIGRVTKNGVKISSGNDFCNELLAQKYVATVSGEAFGTPNHFRLSFSTDMETIKSGIEKIREFIMSLG
ncbi:pyridoxal phosphate-dependent aminotransferase [Candidatus Deianiraea vastatrix]|uniref:Probable aspartate/prephenate aminotransferase n=1 Tax=Candidatus Deianiraea vastatrix TaxID=2163644 RepID=A0A5B8XER0_9RICK|nr:pyridoxal phosphate-dependent aminotransferase [Candidatus Deianiraea vastatrix]QED22894.1 Aspartate aminotransferase [Candidatus Deianiraea vastatrix]